MERKVNNNGIIPESLRPDGSVRKQRKIKQGFVATLDAGKYESRGEKNKKIAAKKYGKVPGLIYADPKAD